MIPIRVLIVDDSESDAALLVQELKHGGFDPQSVRVESRGELECALRSQEWDLVLSDYTMPQMTVMDSLAVLKEHLLDLPFIVVSGVIGEEAAVDAMKAGANDVIAKDHQFAVDSGDSEGASRIRMAAAAPGGRCATYSRADPIVQSRKRLCWIHAIKAIIPLSRQHYSGGVQRRLFAAYGIPAPIRCPED